MAIKPTICRLSLELADLDRDCYGNFVRSIALHPSETQTRMMVRVLAFVLCAEDALDFGRGLSTDDEPALRALADDGTVSHWIEVGLPDPKRLLRAAGRAARLSLYTYGDRKTEQWWARHGAELERIPQLHTRHLDDASAERLTACAARDMRLQCTVQDGTLYLQHNDTDLVLPALRERP